MNQPKLSHKYVKKLKHCLSSVSLGYFNKIEERVRKITLQSKIIFNQKMSKFQRVLNLQKKSSNEKGKKSYHIT